MSSAYAVPAAGVEVIYEIKKSRFIARAARAANRDEAMAHLQQAQADYPDARHHCWAYLIGNPYSPTTAAMSDDGEPSGTAGKPILNVLQHKQVGDIMLVVSRYFGGIKLGAGGLVRAYSHAAQMAMTDLPLAQVTVLAQRQAWLDFAQEQPLRHWLGLHGGNIIDVHYATGVEVLLECPGEALEELSAFAAGQQIRLATL